MKESLEKLAKQYNIPTIIGLETRFGTVDAVLVLIGAIVGERAKVDNPLFNYKIISEYPYGLMGDKPNYIAIDFSGGPNILLGEEVTSGLFLNEIDPPLLALELKINK